MKMLDALRFWLLFKPLIAKLKALFPEFFEALEKAVRDADTTPALPPNHPDRKRKWPDDADTNTNG
jgi:hypothetical protein